MSYGNGPSYAIAVANASQIVQCVNDHAALIEVARLAGLLVEIDPFVSLAFHDICRDSLRTAIAALSPQTKEEAK